MRQTQTDREARVGRTSQVPARTRSPAPVSSGFVEVNMSQAEAPHGAVMCASHLKTALASYDQEQRNVPGQGNSCREGPER